MRIQGVETMEETGTVEFPRKKLTVPIHALSPRFELDLARQLPEPRAPESYARDKDGALILKGNKPQRVVDEADPTYVAAVKERNVLIIVAVVYHGTSEGGPVEWDTPRETLDRNPSAFYRGLLDELCAMKFRQGDLLKWWAAIQKLSGLSDEEVEAAAESFPNPER